MLSQKTLHDISVTMYCCMYANCGSEYATKFNLKRHVESVHMRIKKFKCETCGTMFSSKQSLKEHFHIHLNSMPFKCISCNKAFRQASQLSLHKRIHAVKGTPSLFTKNTSTEDYLKCNYAKVEPEIVERNLDLAKISEERKGVLLLPFPRIIS